MTIGTRVVHCMGHEGVIVGFDGPLIALVRFTNTTDRVFVSNLTEVLA